MKIAILWVLLSVWIIGVLANGTRADHIDASKLPQNDLILISTIDGYLIAIDSETGKQKWRFKEGPIINSPRDALSGLTFIPNPRNGQLYSLEDGDLGKLPFTIPEAVKGSPGRTTNGILYSGDKKDVWISINIQTGTKLEFLPPPAEKFLDDVTDDQCIVHAFIGRTEYHLKIMDSKSPDREWNVSFTDYSSHLLPHDAGYPLQHFINDGKVITVDGLTGRILWKKDFQSIIVNLYLLKTGGLQLLPSHSVGKKVFDAILENPTITSEFNNFDAELNFIENSFKTYYTAEHVEKITNGRFRASLFVGETLTGLFAMPSFISTTGSEVPKLLGPKVVDRVETQLPSVEVMENQPLIPRHQLSANIPIKMTTYKTVGGEYLLLGYHIYPRSIMKDVLFNDPTVFSFSTPHRFLYDPLETRVTVSQPSRRRLPGQRQPALPGNPSLPRIQYKPEEAEDDDLTLPELLLVFWKAYPLAVMTISATVIALTVATIYMCGRQSAFNLSTSQQSREVSRVSQKSPDFSDTKSNPMGGTFSRGSRASTSVEEDIDPSLPYGWRQIGKIQYNPNAVLGTGCEGTIVYKGKFDGREAAVKRVITEAVTFVDREIDLLRESDSHQNVIRYFCSEADHNFRFIALELCECTLLDYVMKPEIQRELADVPKVDILRQASEGLLHLHNNNIIHRDIKPHNILLTRSSKGIVKAMISDFGLCKKLKLEHTSMSKVSGIVGTEGWQAAELYLHEHRVTYAVDVFSMGCVYFYVLTNGKHPYGDKFHRQNNILMGEYNLTELAAIDTSFNIAALNLIESMIQLKYSQRPRLKVVLSHPMFWNNERQLQFFMDVSDRIEKEDETNDVVQRLERYGPRVSRNWQNEICSYLREDLRKFRSYRPSSIRDLLRALRNKKHHYRELPPLVKESLGDIPNGYADYWTKRFPRLLMHIYNAMICCAEESAFATYYPMEAHSFCNRRLEEELDNDFITAGPGGFLKHTTSTPAMPTSPSRVSRVNQSTIRTNSSTPDDWRQRNTTTTNSTATIATPISHAPMSANAAKKRKKKKKAPLTVLAPMEESDDEQQQQHENSPGGDDINNDDDAVVVIEEDREMSPPS